MSPHTPQRFPEETQEAYRQRQKLSKKIVKRKTRPDSPKPDPFGAVRKGQYRDVILGD